VQQVEILQGIYHDSVTLMRVAQEINKIDGVEEATLNMATEANMKIMEAAGFDFTGFKLSPSDLMIAVKGKEEVLSDAVARAKEYLVCPPWKKSQGFNLDEYNPKSIGGALSILSDANLALISVAGRYAGAEAQKCLDRGLHVMLYSDNVPLETEVKIKQIAKNKNLLVMGPDCGTAVIRGKGLGFANACPVGPIGMVAAAGTGLQEVHVQLARRGVGVLHAIGTGGRDVKEVVGGMTTLSGIDALIEDDEIKVIIVIGKPPAASVEQKVIEKLERAKKPSVIGFMGSGLSGDRPPVYLCGELEETAAVAAALALGEDIKKARERLTRKHDSIKRRAFQKRAAQDVNRGFLRGLYSGGTLCYEAQLIAADLIGPVYSNAPLRQEMFLPDSLKSIEHSMVDFGEDEFTQGRLHPMMDSSFRAKRIVIEAGDPEVKAVLFDCVIGYGCHPNPADQLAKAVEQALGKARDGVTFISSVCGVDADPQNAERQREILESAGVVVLDSNAEAARFACYMVMEDG
jgi:FdrA protein